MDISSVGKRCNFALCTCFSVEGCFGHKLGNSFKISSHRTALEEKMDKLTLGVGTVAGASTAVALRILNINNILMFFLLLIECGPLFCPCGPSCVLDKSGPESRRCTKVPPFYFCDAFLNRN